jgi:hypothetical protein
MIYQNVTGQPLRLCAVFDKAKMWNVLVYQSDHWETEFFNVSLAASFLLKFKLIYNLVFDAIYKELIVAR